MKPPFDIPFCIILCGLGIHGLRGGEPMVRIICKLMVLIVGFTLLILGFTPVQAAPITVPTGLSPGDQYRLVFVTSGTRDATSTDIGDYNSFVTGEAASSVLTELQTQWFAIASTQYTWASQNTNTDLWMGEIGVPIYNLAGEIVATDYYELWHGSVSHPIDVLSDGNRLQDADMRVWTGTGPEGWPPPFGGPLGVTNPGTGLADSKSYWIWDLDLLTDYWLSLHRMYAMSGILTVQNPVPAPTSLVLLSSGIFGLLGLRRKARKV